MTGNKKICWIGTLDIKAPDGKILQDALFIILRDSSINYDEKPILIVKKRGLVPFGSLTKPAWVLVDPIKKKIIKELPRKPSPSPPGLRKYKDPISGEKRPLILCDASSGGLYCQGCKKVNWGNRRPESFDPLRKLVASPENATFLENFINSDGDLVIQLKSDPPEILLIATNKKFKLRDYCTTECQKRAKNIRRLYKRLYDLSKKYNALQEDERPDGCCKICGKNITDKRAGALTCCPAHRQQYKRMKSLKNSPLLAPSSSLSLRDRPSVP